jgi:hypothetical protein
VLSELSDDITRVQLVYRRTDTVGLSSITTRRTSDLITNVTGGVFERLGARVHDGMRFHRQGFAYVEQRAEKDDFWSHKRSHLWGNVRASQPETASQSGGQQASHPDSEPASQPVGCFLLAFWLL